MAETREVDLNHPLAKPRVPHEIMFVVGGWSGGSPTNIIETYDTRADRWITIDHGDYGNYVIYIRFTTIVPKSCLLYIIYNISLFRNLQGKFCI